jgi:hypothetical protein
MLVVDGIELVAVLGYPEEGPMLRCTLSFMQRANLPLLAHQYGLHIPETFYKPGARSESKL